MKVYCQPICKVAKIDFEESLMAGSNGPGNMTAGGDLSKKNLMTDDFDAPEAASVSNYSVWEEK
ncbi:MAG: hypothetical protein MSD82_07510 [Prevotella sp.]|nr:hypothetical protein [Prevotella sp.]